MGDQVRVLKLDAGLPRRRVEAEVLDADRRVREALSAAEAEASRLVAEARGSADAVTAAAERAGWEAGQARAGAVLAAASAARDRVLREAERELATLAVEIARRVLGRELATDPAAVADLAAVAVAEARARRTVTLRVSPQDAAAVRATAGRLAALLERAALEIAEDPSLGPGGIVVDTDGGRLDARIETQLGAFARALEEGLP